MRFIIAVEYEEYFDGYGYTMANFMHHFQWVTDLSCATTKNTVAKACRIKRFCYQRRVKWKRNLFNGSLAHIKTRKRAAS